MTNLEFARLRRLFKPPCKAWRAYAAYFRNSTAECSVSGAEEGAKVARIVDGRVSGRSRVDGFLFEGLKGGSGESLEDEAQLGHQLLGVDPCIWLVLLLYLFRGKRQLLR